MRITKKKKSEGKANEFTALKTNQSTVTSSPHGDAGVWNSTGRKLPAPGREGTNAPSSDKEEKMWQESFWHSTAAICCNWAEFSEVLGKYCAAQF